MGIVRIISLFFAVIMITSTIYAADESYYVSQSGAGERNGMTVENAWALVDFNNPDNWSKDESLKKINLL